MPEKTKNETTNTSISVDADTKNTVDTIKSVIINKSYTNTDSVKNYFIDSLKINGDILSIFINYSGGCKNHTFELIGNKFYAKSLPPQTTVYLVHNNNGDSCRELIQSELKFNIKQLKYSGQNAVIVYVGKSHRIAYITE